MPEFGLIGYPIAHSLSPELFREASGGRYRYDLIETPDFDEAWNIFLKDYRGVNVTAPFKEQAFAKADLHSPVCARIGACNIAVKSPGGIKAYNSDYLAVKALLKGLEGRVVIAGYGGAGKAAALAASDAGFETAICNRTTSKAEGILPLEMLPELAAHADILIYTLPVAIRQLETLPRMKVIIEANYANPNLEGHAERYISGREWVREQAARGFELLTACSGNQV